MNKKTKSAQFIKKFEHIFQCPICSTSMEIIDLKSFVCMNKHTFDIAKQGYVNVMTYSPSTKYDKELFESRKTIIDEGFFEPLHKTMSELINHGAGLEGKTLKILDAGCGDGSHLVRINEAICSSSNAGVIGIGIDIAKEGIMVAAKNYANMIWCVADLTHSPFKSNTFDVVLNILSPANYNEFRRLLNGSDIVIKVVPQSDYLKELRETLLTRRKKQAYSNEKVMKRFEENFKTIEKLRLRYKKSLTHSFIRPLIRMTPLSWAATEEKIQSLFNSNLNEITIDLEIVVGKIRD